MPPVTPEQESPMENRMPAEEQDNPTPQFQLVLRASDGDHVIAASDTVNDMVDQARYWINVSPAGMKMLDNDVQSLILQEVDPATGAYVDSKELPVEDKKDIITKARQLGSR